MRNRGKERRRKGRVEKRGGRVAKGVEEKRAEEKGGE